MASSFEFDEAIQAHNAWMERLEAFTRGQVGDEIDLDTASDFNRCGLGQWINRDREDLVALTSFAELEKTHRLFHTVAGDVICLVREQQGRMAELLLKGTFAELSTDIVRLIGAVKREYQAAHP